MKSTALMTLPKAEVMNVTKKKQKKQMPNMAELEESDNVVDKLWDMYQKQMQRTHDMMVLCEILQKENEELKRNQMLIEVSVEEKKPIVEKERKLQTVGYDRLKILTKALKDIFQSDMSRTAYANALVHMLDILYQLKGEAATYQLFAAAELTDITGFRYIKFLKKARMVTYKPTTNKGYYMMTEIGKQFVQGKLLTQEEFCKACGIKRMYELSLS